MHSNMNDFKKLTIDTSRPFAKKLYDERVTKYGIRTKTSNGSVVSMSSEQTVPQTKLNMTRTSTTISMSSMSSTSLSTPQLEISKSYPMHITQVNSPDNFFVELKQQKTNPIRCKLHSVEPLNSKEWSIKVIEMFLSLKLNNNKEELEIKIYSCDDYFIDNKREKVYSVDIIFGGVDSVIDYLIENDLAVKKNEEAEYEEDRYSFNQTHNFENDFPTANNTYDLDEIDQSLDEAINLAHSVSHKDFQTSYIIDQFNSLKQLTTPNERRGMFNCSFKVWKKKDLAGFAQIYKIGQTTDVIVSYIDDSRKFFIQDEKRLGDLNYMENCFQKYAEILLSDEQNQKELFMFQNKIGRHDVVLVRASWDKKWHRAIYLDRMTSRDFNSIVDDDELLSEHKLRNEKSYHSFFLIDYGREDLVITRNNDPNSEIFILPITNPKVMQIGFFALKCSINESYIKQRGLCLNDIDLEMKLQNEQTFEKCFKETLLNRRVKMRISQMTTVRSESEAIVELFFHADEADVLVQDLNRMNLMFLDENLIDVNAKNNQIYLKLTCVQYVIKKAKYLQYEMKSATSHSNLKDFLSNTDSSAKIATTTPISPPSSMSSVSSISTTTQTTTNTTTTKSTPPPKPILKEKEFNIISTTSDSKSNNSSEQNKPINTQKQNQKPSITTVKLNKNEIYTVMIQYFDEAFQDDYFYLTLAKNLNQLCDLDNQLQTDTHQTQLITSIKEIKTDDYLEALYDLDLKWYRVQVTSLTSNTLLINFLDFGNIQTLTHQDIIEHKLLRKRQLNTQTNEIFYLNYQAIKCCYLKDGRPALKEFITKLTQIPNADDGFDIIVNDYKSDTNVYTIQFFDLKTPTSVDLKKPSSLEDVNDDDVFSLSININQQMCSLLTMSDDEIGLSLSINVHYQSVITHVESSAEFYVQPNCNLKTIIDHQMRVQKLSDLCLEYEFKLLQGQPNHQIGDLCIAKHCDSTWYRGVVVGIKAKDDEYLYDVFLVDYGNTTWNLNASFMYSINTIKNAIKSSKIPSLEQDLKQIIELPFQAVCCELDKRKESTRNTEILKMLISACPNFNIAIRGQNKHALNEQLYIKKYLVNLYSDEKLLDDEFELNESTPPLSQTVSIGLNSLKENEVYEFKMSHFGFETEMFVNISTDLDDLNALQNQINNNFDEINTSTSSVKYKVNDFVLAKFYEDAQLFNWYRAKIVNIINDFYQVIYIDYGNTDTQLTQADLRPLPRKYTKQAQFAYNIRLNGINDLKIDQNQFIIVEYLTSDNYKMKVIKKENDYYLVELWNTDQTNCLNKLINSEYKSPCVKKQIETSQLNDLFQNEEIKIKTKYMYNEDFKRPFYFCLLDDMHERDELTLRLNNYYSNRTSLDLVDFKIGDYCAILSQNEWYRSQIKLVSENQIQVFFIDYGYEELVDPKEKRLKVLVDEFVDKRRFIFGAYLLEPYKDTLIQFNSSDESDLAPYLEKFFTGGDDELEIKVKTRILSDCQYENEFYFGIEILNKNGANLNKTICDAIQILEEQKEVQSKKPKMPNYIRLGISDMPEQVRPIPLESDDRFMIYNKDDLIYVFHEKRINSMQESVRVVCDRILAEREQYEDDILQLPAKGDLVYAKYEVDENWYRCLITNCNQVKNKYELLFIDFGNTEINSKEDILYGLTSEHVELFKQHPAIAYKAKLV